MSLAEAASTAEGTVCLGNLQIFVEVESEIGRLNTMGAETEERVRQGGDAGPWTPAGVSELHCGGGSGLVPKEAGADSNKTEATAAQSSK